MIEPLGLTAAGWRAAARISNSHHAKGREGPEVVRHLDAASTIEKARVTDDFLKHPVIKIMNIVYNVTQKKVLRQIHKKNKGSTYFQEFLKGWEVAQPFDIFFFKFHRRQDISTGKRVNSF